VVGAIDIDPTACSTYRANHPEVRLLEDDLKQVDPRVFQPLTPNGLDLLAVCAPCQPFSARNRHRFTRNTGKDLVLSAIPFVAVLRPRMVFFENVPGLGKDSVFEDLAKELATLGYHLAAPRWVDAADLGVPQRRQRIILVGAQKRDVLESVCDLPKLPRVSVAMAIGDLPLPAPPNDTSYSDPLHVMRAHAPITLERLKNIPPDGGTRHSLPEHLQLRCHKGLKPNQFPDSYGRLRWNEPAPTLTTGCHDLTKGRYAHPEQHRAITLREAARLQSFPDTYTFSGKRRQIAIQIGNAVPPRMMEEIGITLRAALAAADGELVTGVL